MIQELLVVLLFIGALVYLGRRWYLAFKAKKACEACSCSATKTLSNLEEPRLHSKHTS